MMLAELIEGGGGIKAAIERQRNHRRHRRDRQRPDAGGIVTGQKHLHQRPGKGEEDENAQQGSAVIHYQEIHYPVNLKQI